MLKMNHFDTETTKRYLPFIKRRIHVDRNCTAVDAPRRGVLRLYRRLSRKWGWTELYSTPKGAEAVAALYPAGGAVSVYYDPAAPASAVLEPGNRAGSYAPLFFSGGFGLAAFVMSWCFAYAS